MWKPEQPRWTSIQANRSKNGALNQKVKVQNIKRKHHVEPLSGALKTSGETFDFKFQNFTSKYRVIFSETFELLCSACIWNLYVEPFNLDVEPWCETFLRNLFAEPLKKLCEVFIQNLHDKSFATCLCGTFMWDFGNLSHSVEPFSGNLKPEFVEPRNL